jgi:HSP20 family protein
MNNLECRNHAQFAPAKNYSTGPIHHINTPFRIKDTEGEVVISCAAPGREKSDFSLQLKDNLLTIKLNEIDESNKDNQDINPMAHRGFEKNFVLSDKIDTTNIKAHYEKGILTVVLGKKPAPTAQNIQIL